MRALIVGSESARGAIAAARALRRSGWIVGLGSPEKGPVSGSRAISRTHPVPPPHDVKAFVKAVNAAIVAGGYEVVFGSGDAEVLALSSAAKNVRAAVPYPGHDRVVEALDKSRLMQRARSLGLKVPNEHEPTPEGLSAARYPVIVKAEMHWSPERSDAAPRIEATIARKQKRAAQIVARLTSQGARPIVQEMIEGDLIAYTALADEDSKVIGAVQQRAAYTWPPRSGVSVRAITEPVDESLRSKVGELLEALQWFGIAQLQFISGPDGEPHLIDLNGRFYGSLALAIGAGCDLASAWANLATGRPLEIHAAQPGVRYHWLEGDLRRAFVERRGGLAADIRSCLSYGRGAVHSVWSVRDPGPALSYAAALTGRAFRKAVR